MNTRLKLDMFICKHDVDYTENTITEVELESLCSRFELNIGRELRAYLLKYGYLGYKHIEFFGINSVQRDMSDMIRKTLSFRKEFPNRKKLIAIKGGRDDDQLFVNEKDEVIRYVPYGNQFICVKNSLFEYILEVFENIQ